MSINILFILIHVISLLSFTKDYARDNLLPIDASVVGIMNSSEGIGKIAPIFIDALSNHFTINFIATFPALCDFKAISPKVKKLAHAPRKECGQVSILTDLLWDSFRSPYKFVPEASFIKLAYSMVEFSKAPKEWAEILNTQFDAVIVPDEWLVSTYENSGVTIPIFVLPLISPLEKFLGYMPRVKPKSPFIFGTMSAVKNTKVTVEAFIQAFGASQDVRLRLHFKQKEFPEKEQLISYIEQKRALGYTNIEPLDLTNLSSEEYIRYMKDFDCYVCLSNGEGFAFPPREALALGIPVILTNQTALRTICQTGFVRSVPAYIPIPAHPRLFNNQPCGHYFQCTIKDATAAFVDVYKNYPSYKQKALRGREWTKNYLKKALKQKYCNLIKPLSVTLGNNNLITDTGITTNSFSLYKKYKKLVSDLDKG